jgi:hypothetical protein
MNGRRRLEGADERSRMSREEYCMSLMTLSFPSVTRRASRRIRNASWDGRGLASGVGAKEERRRGGRGDEDRSVIVQVRERRGVC